ncbi:MAG: undecaprenyl-diphosphate phosphatase [Bradymonadales bacterium]|nr:undecaprenyl-diphosphate phosphatase [Bradymonadales bacterium]
MTLIEAILLGAVQGITEFLPISSSGHLRLAEIWLDATPPSLFFDIALHLGTLLAVIVMFRRDLAILGKDLVGSGRGPWLDRIGVRQLGLIALACIPTGLIGVALRPVVSERPGISRVAFLLCANGLLLLSTWSATVGRQRGFQQAGNAHWGISWKAALGIGIVQGLAVLPGISRSGITIAAALWLGIAATPAATFSFLISIPAILGALVVESGDLSRLTSREIGQAMGGMVVAFALGLVCLFLLMAILKRARFHHFGWYCLGLGLVVLGLNGLR